MSGSSDYTKTPNLGLFKPTFNADVSNWGQHWNQNADTLDAAFPHGSSSTYLPLSGGTMNGAMVLSGDASAALNPVTLQQLNTKAGTYLPLAGGTMTGLLTANAGMTVGGTATLGSGSAGAGTGLQVNNNANFSKQVVSTGFRNAGGVVFSTAAASSYFLFTGNMSGNTTETPTTTFAGIQIANDTVTTTGNIDVLNVLAQPRGGHTGSRVAVHGRMTVQGAPTGAISNFYVASQGDSYANVNIGGTAPAPAGALRGAEFGSLLDSGATFWANNGALEISAGIAAGASAQFHTRIAIEANASEAVRGTDFDAGITFMQDGALNSPMIGIGIAFGHPGHQWYFASDSCLIGAVDRTLGVGGGNARPLVADRGLDYWKVNFTTASIQVPGAQFDRTGQLSVNNASLARTATGMALDVAGVIVTGGTPAVGGTAYIVGDYVYEPTSKSIFSVASIGGGSAITGLTLLVPGTLAAAPGGPLPLRGGNGNQAATVTLATAANRTLSLNPSGGAIVLPLLTNAASDAAAASAGVAVGQLYRNASVVMQRVA